jgi:NAD(P)-dependent dehydrogenase (short-subunit alcohol dehydrogenase family)
MAKFLLIGASSLIAQETKKILVSNNHQVITTSRDSSKINPDYILNPSNFVEVENLFKDIEGIDGVANFSGSLLLKSAHLTSQEQYESVINASLTTSFAVVRAAGKYMSAKGGSVVLISSAAAISGFANHEAIAAAKAGIIGLMMSAAATYANNNLRFNAVAPGLVETPLTTSITQSEASRKISCSMHPLGRIGKAEDVARGIVFLLDPSNSWITGQTLAIDGGLSTVHTKIKV